MRFLLFTILLLSTVLQAQNQYSRVRIFTEHHKIHQLIGHGLSCDHGVNRPGVYYETELNQNDIAILQQNNVPFEVIARNANDYYAQRRAVYQNRAASNCDQPDNTMYQTPENFELGSFEGFFTYAEMLQELDEMAQNYPTIITVKAPIGDFETHEGNQIFHVKISDNPYINENDEEPQTLFTALHHAREPVSLSQMIYFMWYVLENYGTDPQITYMVNNFEMFFVPCVNPDGYIMDNELSFDNGGGQTQFAFWRKNLRDNNNNNLFESEFDGVDLNRNYGYAWGPEYDGSSPDPTSIIYHGPSAMSEPEVQAIAQLAIENNFQITMNYHTYGDYLIHPWGFVFGDPTPDSTAFRSIAKLLTKENNYIYGTGDETLNYLVNGDTDDWMYGEQDLKNKVFSYTPEAGASSDGFYPPQERIIPICNEVLFQNINAVLCTGNHYDIIDESDEYINILEGSLNLSVQRHGLLNGSVNVSIINNSDNVSVAFNSIEYTDMQMGEIQPLPLNFQLNPNIIDGETFSITLGLNNGDFVNEITIEKTYINPEGIPDLFTWIDDQAETLDFWDASGNWGLTEQESYSPPTSISNAPYDQYYPNELTTLNFIHELDLTETQIASVKFFAKWDIEGGYDYMQMKAIDINTLSQTTLCGKYTTTGNYYLAADEPIWDGTQSEWVEEEIDLGMFAGQQIKLQFEFFSDGFVNGEGFYFDDFRVFSDIELEEPIDTTINDTTSIATNLALINNQQLSVYPNPANNSVSLITTSVANPSILITDISGRLIATFNNNYQKINTQNWAEGIYYIQLKNNDKTVETKKLIIAH